MKNASLMVLLFILLNCSKESETLACSQGYPRSYSNQTVLYSRIDVFNYDSGSLTFARSIFQTIEPNDRTIQLISRDTLLDTNQQFELEYVLNENNCIKDYRDYHRMTLNEDCSSIFIDYLSVGVREKAMKSISWVTSMFDCEKTDSIIINEAIAFFEQGHNIDSVYLDMSRFQFNLIN